MFFESMRGLVRVAVIGAASYSILIVLLRVSGKRTLAKLNAFDFVVTVALGSTLATVLLSTDVALVEGVLGLAMLIGLQFAIAWSSVRWPRFTAAVKAQPVVVAWQGQLLDEELRRERVTVEEVRQALRQQGLASLHQAAAVVLETDGSISVLRNLVNGPSSSLEGVRNAAPRLSPSAEK